MGISQVKANIATLASNTVADTTFTENYCTDKNKKKLLKSSPINRCANCTF